MPTPPARWTPLLCALALASSTAAWTPNSQRRIAEEAARLVPPDLYRQLGRHRQVYLQGAVGAFKDREPDTTSRTATAAGSSTR